MSVLLALQGAPGDITGSGASVLVLTDTGTAFLIFEGTGSSSLILVDAGTGQLIFEGNGASTLVLVDAGIGTVEGAAPVSGGGGHLRYWHERHDRRGRAEVSLSLQAHGVATTGPSPRFAVGRSVFGLRAQGQGRAWSASETETWNQQDDEDTLLGLIGTDWL